MQHKIYVKAITPTKISGFLINERNPSQRVNIGLDINEGMYNRLFALLSEHNIITALIEAGKIIGVEHKGELFRVNPVKTFEDIVLTYLGSKLDNRTPKKELYSFIKTELGLGDKSIQIKLREMLSICPSLRMNYNTVWLHQEDKNGI